jgi:hypothetical protein
MSATDRLTQYDDEVGLALWNAVRALNERAMTLESLAADAVRREDPSSAKEFDQQARAAYEQARVIYELMQDVSPRGP